MRSGSGAFSIRPSWGIATGRSGPPVHPANPRYCEIVGRSEEELYQLRIEDITHPDDLAGTYPSSTNSQQEDRHSRWRNGTSGRMGRMFGSTIAYRRHG